MNGVAVRAVGPWGVAKGPGGLSRDLSTYDSAGSATLSDAALPSATEEIVFLKPASGVRSVGTLALSNRTLRFTATNVVLRTTGKASVFRLTDGRWTFDGISVEGSGLPDKAHYHGGAIDCQGGSLTVTNCSFARLGTRFSGGAISARLMTGDVTISDCTFATNRCGTLNGSGGAVYASGVRGGETVTLTLSNCRFCGNSAQNGGAVTTVHTVDDEETPVSLDVFESVFEKNTAEYAGGAMAVDGACAMSCSVFTDNTAGLQGGAVNLGSSRDECAYCYVGENTAFLRNRTMNATEWTCGGAIALWGEGAKLEVDGRYVIFRDNAAESGDSGYGGAVFASSDTVAYISRAEFNGNAADDGGGAIYAWGNETVITTSVFSNDTVAAGNGFGGAVAADSAKLAVTNTTVRFANRGAVSAYASRATIVNTVIADNGGEADVEAYGEGASLKLEYSAYGTVAASEAVKETIVTNACISGVEKSIFLGDTLLLDTSSPNPVASDGMEQDATDYRDVEYGWQFGTRYSMGAFECPAPPTPVDPPMVGISRVVWYHNRADGRYYPQITVRFLGGDASLFTTVTLRCDGKDYPLPQGCVDRLKKATTAGQEFVFGVDEAHWKPSANSAENFGYIVGWKTAAEKAELMLFSVEDPTRSSVTVIEEGHPIEIRSTAVAPVREESARTVLSACSLPMSVSMPAQFDDFRVGESISGRTTVPTSASVVLYGCTALGEAWRSLGPVELDAEGRFTVAVPSDVRFFQLKTEVPR